MMAGQNRPRIEKKTAPNSDMIGAKFGTMAAMQTVRI